MVTPASIQSLPSLNLLRKSLSPTHFRIQGCHLLWPPIPRCFTNEYFLNGLLQPRPKSVWALPFSLVAYSGNLLRFLFLRLLRYFSSAAYRIHLKSEDHHKGEVSPFGHKRITASSQLPVHFRGVARPSSARIV